MVMGIFDKIQNYIKCSLLLRYLMSMLKTLFLLCIYIEDKENKLFNGNCLFF